MGMMSNYYYLISGLPDLNTPEQIAEIDAARIQAEILELLSPEDQVAFRFLLYRNDNKNLLTILKGLEGIKGGNTRIFHRPAVFTHQEMEEGTANPEVLPGYMRIYLEEHNSELKGSSESIRENRLVELYYEAALQSPNQLIREFFAYKRNLKNIISALNGRIYKHSIPSVLVGESELTEELLKSNAADFGLSNTYSFIPELTELIKTKKFQELEEFVDRLLIDFLDEKTTLDVFGPAAVFAYFLKLSMKHRWLFSPQKSSDEELKDLIQNILKSTSRFDEPIEAKVE